MTTFRFMAFGPSELAQISNMGSAEYGEFMADLSDDELRDLVADFETYMEYRVALRDEVERRKGNNCL